MSRSVNLFFLLLFIISKFIVISTECLNQKSEWNLDYFNRLRIALSVQKNEFKYTLSDVKDEPLKKMVFFLIYLFLSFFKLKVSEIVKKEKSNAEVYFFLKYFF